MFPLLLYTRQVPVDRRYGYSLHWRNAVLAKGVSRGNCSPQIFGFEPEQRLPLSTF